MFRNKNITDLRQIAISFGVKDVFGLSREELEAGIIAAQEEMARPARVELVKPEYDARLMNKPPSKRVNPDELRVILGAYVLAGLELSFDAEMWYMELGERTDQGSLRMPMSAVLRCAQKLIG